MIILPQSLRCFIRGVSHTPLSLEAVLVPEHVFLYVESKSWFLNNSLGLTLKFSAEKEKTMNNNNNKNICPEILFLSSGICSYPWYRELTHEK